MKYVCQVDVIDHYQVEVESDVWDYEAIKQKAIEQTKTEWHEGDEIKVTNMCEDF